MSAPVDCEPLTALAADQAPEAVQAVALVDDQGGLGGAAARTGAGQRVGRVRRERAGGL